MSSLLIKGIQKTSLIDYPGKVVATVFVGICNFRCPFCYNKDLVIDYDGLPTIKEEEIINYSISKKKWLDGVCMSIPFNEPVLVKKDSVIRNCPIQELWNPTKKIIIDQQRVEIQNTANLKTYTLSQQFLPVKKIIRHKTKELFDIKTSSNYKISTTGNHSVFVLGKNGINTKKVSKLTVNDYLLTPKKISLIGSIETINVEDYFQKELTSSKNEMEKRKSYWLGIIKSIINDKLSFVKASKKFNCDRHVISNYFKNFQKDNLEYMCYNSNPDLFYKKGNFLWVGRNRVLPLKIKFSKELAELLGYAVAEGSCNINGGYRFSLGNELRLAKRILKLYRYVFKTESGTIQRNVAKTGNTQYNIVVGGRYVSKLFGNMVGIGAGNKKVPYIMFNTSSKDQLAFIIAINVGDGHNRARKKASSEEFSIKTVSRQLCSDLTLLLKNFGIHALVTIEKGKKNRKTSYKIYFHGNQFLKLSIKNKIKTKYSFLTNIEGIPNELIGLENHKMFKGFKRININKIPLRYKKTEILDVCGKWDLLKVKEITKRNLKKEIYVYDLVVPKDNSFVGGMGSILLHNTGGEPTIHKELSSFVKKIKQLGFLVKIDTNGSNPKMLKKLIDGKLVDYIAMDIKAPLEKYEKVVMVKVNRKDIQESVDIIKKGMVDYEFRTTVVPGLFSKEDAEKIGKWLEGSKRFFIQQFRPDEKVIDKAYKKRKPFEEEELEEFKRILERHIRKVEIRGI